MSEPPPFPPVAAGPNKHLPWIIGLAVGLPLLMMSCCCCSCVMLPSGDDGTNQVTGGDNGEAAAGNEVGATGSQSLEKATQGRSAYYKAGYKAGLDVVNNVKASNNGRAAKQVLLRKNIEHFQERMDHFSDFGSRENTEWNEGARDAVENAEQTGAY